MFKKDDRKELNYYDVLIGMASCSLKAAQQLEALATDFTNVTLKAGEIHSTEHDADNLLHDMMVELNRAFITPIDREDIMALANNIDSITDAIEDVSNLFDVYSIRKLRTETPLMTELIAKACRTLHGAVIEFKAFKVSKRLKDYIIEVNRIEEEGDRMHRRLIKDMYSKESDPLEIMKWKDIYDTMERVLDLCEDTADLIENVSVKNS